MQTLEIKTLIDITNTGVKRPNQGTIQELDQYKNWITLNQCIEMRGNISYDSEPYCDLVDVKHFDFGKKYKGEHRVWTWRFTPDRNDVFDLEQNPLGRLIADLDQIPVIKNLTETINIDRSVFDLSDINYKNTTIQLLQATHRLYLGRSK
jgi:hypothetical protein